MANVFGFVAQKMMFVRERVKCCISGSKQVVVNECRA